ncbi:MAG: helix-turn-helix transcriptional regulator [Acidaminococcaceae bacterium]
MLRLRELRDEAGLTQSKVADDLGISRQSYNFYENGKRELSPDMLKVLSNYFGVSIDYLLNNIPKHNTDNPKDLKRLLESEAVVLNGRMFSQEDKEKILKIVEAVFWEAKEFNKRKK